MSRKALGEAVGFQGDSAYQTVYEWETGRRGVEAAQARAIARALGVSIAELFDESPQPPEITLATPGTGKTERFVQLATALERAFELGPERIQVCVHVAPHHGSEQPSAPAGGDAYEPPLGLRFARRVLAAWPSMDETERQEWRQLAEAITDEEHRQRR